MISIIIPIYNVEAYLMECLQSVANQTLTEGLECILVDDCGPDNSAQIAKEFIAEYHGPVNFRFVQREKNGGLSAARNTGIREAKGEYLYFLDSDDYILPETIETMWELAERYNADLVQAQYISEGALLKQSVNTPRPEFSSDRRYIMRIMLDYSSNPVMAPNRLIRRSLLLDNKLWFREGIIHEDNYWTYLLAKHVKRMAFCPEAFYYYRVTPGSITQNKNIEKETLAFTTMIREFSDNITDYYKGAQKKYIFLHLLIMLNSHYYKDETERKEMIDIFLKQCNIIEKALVLLAIGGKGMVVLKATNLVQRLFLL